MLQAALARPSRIDAALVACFVGVVSVPRSRAERKTAPQKEDFDSSCEDLPVRPRVSHNLCAARQQCSAQVCQLRTQVGVHRHTGAHLRPSAGQLVLGLQPACIGWESLRTFPTCQTSHFPKNYAHPGRSVCQRGHAPHGFWTASRCDESIKHQCILRTWPQLQVGLLCGKACQPSVSEWASAMLQQMLMRQATLITGWDASRRQGAGVSTPKGTQAPRPVAQRCRLNVQNAGLCITYPNLPARHSKRRQMNPDESR